MNKLLTILFLISMTVMLSCSDDEVPGDQTPVVEVDNFIGQWKITSAMCDDGTISLDGGQTNVGTFTQFAKDLDYTINFLEDGTFISNGDVTFETTIMALGQETTVDYPQENWLGAGTWERTNGNLITNTDGDEDVTTSEIILETDSTIELKAALVQDAVFQGISSTNSCTLFYTLTKE